METGVRIPVGTPFFTSDSKILADRWPEQAQERRRLLARVAAGATLVLNEPTPGKYRFSDEEVEVKACGFTPLDFVSRATWHPVVEGFGADDFRNWHDAKLKRIAPLLPATFQAPGWTPILVSGEAGWGGDAASGAGGGRGAPRQRRDPRVPGRAGGSHRDQPGGAALCAPAVAGLLILRRPLVRRAPPPGGAGPRKFMPWQVCAAF